MNLKKVSDKELIFDLKNLICEERELLTTILRYLKEVETRKIYLQKGFSSLFAYLTEELGYSEGAAQRRIQAMRLLKDLPELESKIENGEISLSVASQVQSYLRKEEKKAPLQKKAKLELIKNLAGTSARECERKLIELSPETAMPREKTRPITEDKTLIQFVADKDLMKKIERLKELTSHQNPEGKYDQLISKALDLALTKLDPCLREARRRKTKKQCQQAKQSTHSRSSKSLIHTSGNRPVRSQWPAIVGKALSRNISSTPNPPPTSAVEIRGEPPHPNPLPQGGEGKSRYIPQKLKDRIWLRDQGRCQFQDNRTGKVCGSRHQVEFDHKFPFSLGGEHSEQNLQLRCRNHNLYRAEILPG